MYFYFSRPGHSLRSQFAGRATQLRLMTLTYGFGHMQPKQYTNRRYVNIFLDGSGGSLASLNVHDFAFDTLMAYQESLPNASWTGLEKLVLHHPSVDRDF